MVLWSSSASWQRVLARMEERVVGSLIVDTHAYDAIIRALYYIELVASRVPQASGNLRTRGVLAMRVRFWGTRGSIPKPGPTTLRYGGNTACVEVRTADGTLVVLDCGTGAHELGQALLAEASGPLHGHLLITHTHWDHIQDFAFLRPPF